jgi:REP element-mobilizing transposase RayT
MAQPIVIAYHLVWTAYGWWLPNDLRGSMSHCIRNDIIGELGALHYGRKKIQPASRDIRRFYEDAERTLVHPLLNFQQSDFAVIARAFQETITAQRYTCYACAVMPDHVHILIRKHKDLAEEMIWNLQRESHLRLRDAGIRDMEHPVWGGPGWKVFLDCPEDIRRTVKYIDDNPRKGRLPDQNWGFVTKYDGWPLHPGHDPNSPYAKRLRGRGS